jgi:purine-nucleoside phosphorylase
MLEQIKETAKYLQERTKCSPSVGIILGTGLGALVDEIETEYAIPYEEIPNFPVSTVEGHSGKLIFGKLGGKDVVAMAGRFHFYEGYTMNEVVFPVRVMKFLGIEALFVSNASGGVNRKFEVGDIMIIDDHINIFPTNPLIGKNYPELGPRFPDMMEPYDHKMIAKVEEIALENNIKVVKGTYAGLSGPCLETPAEYQWIYNTGADTVGMSTVPEVIAARHMSIPCFGFSIITDLGVPGKIIEMTHEIVQGVAEKATPKMTLMVKELLKSM